MKRFEISDKQEEKIKEFKEKHKECSKTLPMATDGKYPFTYMFIPGGIGTIAKIKCNVCDEELNITDYDNW